VSLRVGIDLDGVLADFRGAFREAAGALASDVPGSSASEPTVFSEADMKRAWKRVSARANWWVGLRAYEPDQIPRLYALARRGKWEVYFLTKRPATQGDTVQFQTQWWLEQHGFYLPAVLTVPGSRGEIANALHLDIVVDDQPLNCVEVISASPSKALLMVRDQDSRGERERAINRGIGVVSTVEEAIDVLERLHEVIPARRGKLLRLIDWFPGAQPPAETLPLNPRAGHALPDPPRMPDPIR
jgi:hypothetical protein